jgi:hypothetical protein
MPDDVYGFSETDHSRISDMVRREESRSRTGPSERPGQSVYGGGDVVEGFYDEDLVESSNQGQSSSRALFTVWRGVGAQWRKTTEQYTAVNRDDEFSASQGDFGIWQLISGEWRPVTGPGGCDLVRAVLDEALTSIGTAEATIQAYDEVNDMWCETDDTITVLDGLGLGETLVACSPVYAHDHCQSGFWMVIAAPCTETCECNVVTATGECIALADGGALVLACGS